MTLPLIAGASPACAGIPRAPGSCQPASMCVPKVPSPGTGLSASRGPSRPTLPTAPLCQAWHSLFQPPHLGNMPMLVHPAPDPSPAGSAARRLQQHHACCLHPKILDFPALGLKLTAPSPHTALIAPQQLFWSVKSPAGVGSVRACGKHPPRSPPTCLRGQGIRETATPRQRVRGPGDRSASLL